MKHYRKKSLAKGMLEISKEWVAGVWRTML